MNLVALIVSILIISYLIVSVNAGWRGFEYKAKSRRCCGRIFALAAVICVRGAMNFLLVFCGVYNAQGRRGSLLKNSPQDCFYLATLGTVAFESLSALIRGIIDKGIPF